MWRGEEEMERGIPIPTKNVSWKTAITKLQEIWAIIQGKRAKNGYLHMNSSEFILSSNY